MSQFNMKQRGDDEESSDSDRRVKRRKPNPAMNGRAKGAAATPAANPNSFAAKMMAKMGYKEGEGLGASGKGRLAPIDVQLRPQGAGLGAIKEKTKQAKEEEKREAKLRGEVIEDSEEEERQRKQRLKEKRKQGISGAGRISSKPKTKYRTAAEIEAAAEGLEVPNVLKSIIDATGTEAKLLDGPSGLMKTHSMFQREKTYAEKIADRARTELKAFADEWVTLSERKKYLELQESQIAREIVDEEDESRKLDEMISAVQELQGLSFETPLIPESCWEGVTKKLESLADERQIDSSALAEVAVAAIHPLFKNAMTDWEPLENPEHLTTYLKRLRHVLGVKSPSTNTDIALQNGYPKSQSRSTTPYETMIHTFWLPPVRSAIINDWDPYNPTPLRALITAWEPLLPAFILTSLFDNIIVQRLTTALQAWSPQRTSKKHRSSSNQQLPHTYIFEWLPYLSQYHKSPTSTTGLTFTLRQKFKSILATYPLEKAPPQGISDWQPILKSALTTLLTRHLLPRLSTHLSQNLIIDPSDQDLAPLTHVLAWTSALLPSHPEITAHLLIAEFFPKWHQTLHLWLTSDPNYDEIRQWFLWWKEQIPEDIRLQPVVEAEWTKGLEMITLALDLGPENVGAHLPPPISTSTSTSTIAASTSAPTSTKPPPLDPPPPQTLQPEITFRDVVEDWCASESLLFLPLREADPASGQPLFRITASASGRGGVVVFLRGDVVWAREKGEGKGFGPVELGDGLIGRAEGRS